MCEPSDNLGRSSSSSSIGSLQDVEDDQRIIDMLPEQNPQANGSLGRRLSHLDSIPDFVTKKRIEIGLVSDVTLQLSLQQSAKQRRIETTFFSCFCVGMNVLAIFLLEF